MIHLLQNITGFISGSYDKGGMDKSGTKWNGVEAIRIKAELFQYLLNPFHQ